MLKFYKFRVERRQNEYTSVHLYEGPPKNGNLSKGRKYDVGFTQYNTEITTNGEKFETQFDESAKGTSRRTNNGAIILQGDATCLPIVLKEYKDRVDGPIQSFSTIIKEDKSALMLDKFTEGVDIGEIGITFPFDVVKDGCHIQKYVNESLRSRNVGICIEVDDRAAPAKNYPWFGGFISYLMGFKPSTVRDFILGIRALDRFQVRILDSEEHCESPIITEQFVLELCKKHQHVYIENVVRAHSSKFFWEARTIQFKLPKAWRSLEIKATFGFVRAVLSGIAVQTSVVYDADGFYKIVFKAPKDVRHTRVSYIDCFFFDDAGIFFGRTLIGAGYPVEHELCQLRIECNIDPQNHWSSDFERIMA